LIFSVERKKYIFFPTKKTVKRKQVKQGGQDREVKVFWKKYYPKRSEGGDFFSKTRRA
jgi:hypothetical protein